MTAHEWDGTGACPEDDEAPLEDDVPTLRPVVLWGTDLDRVRRDVVQALAHRGRLYQRAHRLVYPVRTRTHGTAIREATRPVVRCEIARVCELQSRGKGVQVTDVLGAIVHDIGEWDGVRVLDGVTRSPTLRPDGTVLQEPGYDAATRTLYVPRTEYRRVSDCPTEDDARAALEVLREPWCDYLWATPSDGSAAIAAMMTLVVRTALPSVPIVLLEAPVAGGGKSLAADVITCGATGSVIARSPVTSNEEEREKQLLSYVISGGPALVLDDVGLLGGHVINAIGTATDTIALRPLGKSELHELPWRGSLLASGNNVRVSGDAVRRVLRCRLDPGVERPEDRTGFRHDPLIPWVIEHHAELVHAALTLVRWGVVACVPRSRQWGSYEAWVGRIASPLVALGCADPTDTRAEITQASDDTRAAQSAVLTGWRELYAPDGITAAELRRRVWTAEPDRALADLRDGLEVLSRARGRAPTAAEVGYALRGMRDRVVGNLVLRRAGRSKDDQTRWAVETVACLATTDQPVLTERQVEPADQDEGGDTGDVWPF